MNSALKKKNKFGPRPPPFIDYLKDILKEYPDGGQILKELIQNADDARATRVAFLYDERQYETHKLWTEKLGKYQGPALYAFNDAEFTDEDWEGIQTVGRSVKRDDVMKVGKFGIGLNSVYHITDLPCVFSSKYLAIFDPQKIMFGEDEEGFRWHLNDEEDRESFMKLTDQFQPFQNIISQLGFTWENVISKDQYFKGTLFRFPLRNEASKISDNLYDSTKVTQLFDDFIADADISLLFLNNVSSITLLHIDNNGLCNERLKISSSNVSVTDHSHIKQKLFDSETCFKTVSHISEQMEKKSQWLVTSCHLKQGHLPEIDSLAKKMSFLPKVDAAFLLDEDRLLYNGRLSCLLPLPNNEPNQTGLPIHINSCFGLTHNRRFIKWKDEDQKNDKSAMWNELLAKEILPHVYLTMILDAIRLSEMSSLPSPTVYKIWPDLSKTVHKGRWHKVARDTLRALFEYKIFHLAYDNQIWVAASKAVFAANNIESNTMSVVSRLLIAEGENLVTVPEHVLKDVQEIFAEIDTLTWVTPSYVRGVLHKSEAENLSKDDKYTLLEFALSDENYTDLRGLKLLPLSDGTFTSFDNEEQNTVLIDNKKFPRTLLPFCTKSFLHSDLSQLCIMQLRKLSTMDIYNIIHLDAQHVFTLMKKHLPMDWKVTQGHVTWETAEDHHPPKSWLVEFWKFLSTECNDLSKFIDIPLIPLEPLHSSGNSVLLAKLQNKRTLIFQSSTGSNLSDNVQNVLTKVGCTVIKRDDCLRHHDIENYILPTSPRNVLRVFLNSNRDQVIKGFASASSHEREELKVYLSSLDSLSIAERELLSMLPIFRITSGKYVAESIQAAISTTNPAIPNDLPMPDTIVQCANEPDRRLLTLLKIELLDAAKMAVHLVDCIKTGIFKNGEEQKIMTWILNSGSILLSQSEQLLTKTRNLNFIATTQGEHKRASDFFDPSNRTFQDLFDVDFFPPPIYTKTQEMLQSLKCLGLKTDQKEISTANILQVINHMEMLCVHSPDKALKKANAIAHVLNEKDFFSKFTQEEIEKLKQRQWVPCDNSMFFTGFYKPAEVRDSKYSSIVGYVMPITSKLTSHVCKSLGLDESPPAEKVLENLFALDKSKSKFPNELHSIYKFMQDNMNDFRDLMNTECNPWIWNKSKFVSPEDVFISYPPELDLSPYVKKVPEELLLYENLLTEFGVKKTVTTEETENVLYKVKERIDCRSPPYGDSTELKLSIAILDWMRKNEKHPKDNTPVPVMAQNQKFNLQPLSKTISCDISAEALDDLKQDNEEFYVIHEEVLPITATWLKVPLLSARIFKPLFKQCGQSEPVTKRIKNIIKEYDEESDVFKELLQNAEDAGASTCKFLLDFRKHRDPTETLIDDGMALCNGPCLWIFNNKLFSPEDWENIVNVGSASKENKSKMIGKFGLGFNSVYHVTDIPSILSGNTLLILDPNVNHLKKHILNKGNPGIQFDPFHERLYKRFPGQFKSYKGIFDCDLSSQNSEKTYNGTLIKLPFRTPEEAKMSAISSSVYDEEHIRCFSSTLTNSSETYLLFLKNIKFMSLQIVPENASTPPQDSQIETSLKISSKVITSFAVSNDTSLQKIADNLRNNIISNDIIDQNKVNIVTIIKEYSKRSFTQNWLLYSCFGSHDSLQMFPKTKDQHQTDSFSVGGIAVPLQREDENKPWSPVENLIGKAHCFLPLSIVTGLPVHINGTFAVTSNRRGLWETGVNGKWNKALLRDAVASAYITTLLELKKMAQDRKIQNYSFYTFWPNREKLSTMFLPLVESFYFAVVQKDKGTCLDLFSNGNNWFSLKKARFLDLNIETNQAVGGIAIKVLLSSGDLYSCVASLPKWVRESFNYCGFTEEINQKLIDWHEFYSTVLENLSAVETHDRHLLVLNAIDLNDPSVDDLLKRYPCIPTQECQELQFIKRVVNPSGKVAFLYDLEEGRFLERNSDYLSSNRIKRLCDLGMLSNCLPLEDMIERAEKVSVRQQDESKSMKEAELIEFMRLLLELGPVDHRIVSLLREVRCIQDIDGSLQMASYFYDDNEQLFTVMLPKERFVPKTFWDNFQDKRPEIQNLLKDIGLKHDVSEDEIIQFAKQIESETKDNIPLDVLKERSEALYITVVSKSNDTKSDLMNKICNIKFIFPMNIDQPLCDYHKAFAQEREVIAISGSLIGDSDGSYQYLIWTTMPILPSEHCSTHTIKKMMDAGALEIPSPEKIAINLKNICKSPCHTDMLLTTRNMVFSKAYEYLQSIHFNTSLFSDLPVILVENDTKLVKACQTVLSLKNDLEFRPYLYSIPLSYIQFEKLFKKIGVEGRPTIDQYSTVLQEIYSESCDTSLQANQQKTVKCVVQQLFCLLKEEKKKPHFQNISLYLPSTDGKVYESNTLFFNDTDFEAARLNGPLKNKLKLLENLNCCYLQNDQYDHQTLLQFLPKHVRPHFLSNLISENLEEASFQYCDYKAECEFSGWFEKRLTSAAFLHELVHLIENNNISQSEAKEKCKIFDSIKIICCKTLRTEILLKGEPLEGSKAERDVYVKIQCNQCLFYLKHKDNIPEVVNEVTMCLTKEINILLKNCLTTSSLQDLGHFLMCDNVVAQRCCCLSGS